MKKIKLIIPVIFCIISINFSLGQEHSLIASCCEGTEAKCVGSSYCKACTNCSRCGHCNSGGSCGVCSTSYRKTSKKRTSSNYTKTGSKKSSISTASKSKPYTLPNSISSKYYLKNLIVNTDELNLRNGPGVSYSIIEKLEKDQELTFLAMANNWVKVKVVITKTEGFVYYKHVLVSSK